jgi:hypothetical protein
VKRIATVSALIWLAFVANQAVACSCNAPPTAYDAAAKSRVVVLAKLKSVALRSSPSAILPAPIDEFATMEVVKSWRGPHRVGQTIRVTTAHESSMCGIPFREPLWEDVDSPNPKRIPLSGNWVIISSSREPYEVSICNSSRPVELIPKEQLERLDQTYTSRPPKSRSNSSLQRDRER